MTSRIRLVSAALAIAVVACVHFTPLSDAQLVERGTHRYAGFDRAKLTEACAAALATLGFKVTVKDPDKGLVKTSPQTIMVSATGGPGYANTTDDGLAWAIAVEASGADVVVHAAPRGFRNGSEVREDGMWVAEVMDAKFKDLWREVDDTIGVKPSH
jgi:hypothetical protein